MLPDLVVELANRRVLTGEMAIAILEAIRPRYRTGVIEYSIGKLREVGGDA